jgi:1,2-diacylglycerol 3-alpha-glucosyltransferase
MKILFATDQYLPTPGGIAIAIERLTKALVKRGHTVYIIAPSTTWKFRKENIHGITVFRVPSILVHKAKQIRYSPTFINKKEIEKIIDDFEPDIIHIETPDAVATTTVEIARKRNIPIIATCHIMPQNITGSIPFLPTHIGKIVGKIYMRQMKHIFNKVDYVTAPTRTGIAILRAAGIRTPAEVVSNGIDLQQFRLCSQKQQNKLVEKYHLSPFPVILYVGRLGKEKKVNILLEALSFLQNSLPFQVVIAGAGEQMRQLKRFAKKLNVDNVVSFIGFVSESNLPTLYSIASIFVMPSTAELQSLVTMEAMALSLPVVGAKAGALPYLIEQNKNGFLFKPDDTRDLANKLRQLLSDREMRKQMGRQSLLLVKKHDIQTVVKRVESLYIRILTERNKLLVI